MADSAACHLYRMATGKEVGRPWLQALVLEVGHQHGVPRPHEHQHGPGRMQHLSVEHHPGRIPLAVGRQPGVLREQGRRTEVQVVYVLPPLLSKSSLTTFSARPHGTLASVLPTVILTPPSTSSVPAPRLPRTAETSPNARTPAPPDQWSRPQDAPTPAAAAPTPANAYSAPTPAAATAPDAAIFGLCHRCADPCRCSHSIWVARRRRRLRLGVVRKMMNPDMRTVRVQSDVAALVFGGSPARDPTWLLERVN